jgi:hypothetical protein
MLHFWVSNPRKMLDSTILTKVLSLTDSCLATPLAQSQDLLQQGDLLACEIRLQEGFKNLYDSVMGLILNQAADSFSAAHKAPKASKSRIRQHTVIIATGTEVKIKSPYYHKASKVKNEARRPLVEYWKLIGNCSPLLYDLIGFFSMLAPSYDLANQALKKVGVDVCTSTTRKVADELGRRCEEVGQENLIGKTGENFAGKTVVISLDGGRTRMRTYTGEVNKNGNEKFHTQWREPKLFVIDILDEEGRPDRHELPMYGCNFSKKKALESLRKFLTKFEIEKARLVQFIGDGASWMWKRVPELILSLGVPQSSFVETLDFYHASHYAHELIKVMPRSVTKKERDELKNDFFNLLKGGCPETFARRVREKFKRLSKLPKRWLKYLEKHANRMQYAKFQALRLMKGSGIIESAVRRVINLRFKNASTFWLEENVENLYFLRGALVSGRWDIVMKNLTQS